MRRIAGIFAVLALTQAVPAAAETIFDDWAAKGLTVTVGVSGSVGPKYEGSDKYLFSANPLFNIRPVGTPPGFTSARESFGFTLVEFGGFAFGPAIALERIRRVNTEPMPLSEFERARTTLEIGAFAEYWFVNWLRYRAELRQGVTAGQGFIADQMIDAVARFGPWTLSAGPRMRIVDNRANSRSFDISAAQSLTSGLPVYDAGGGVRSVGAGAKAVYRFNPQWAVHGFVEYDRLVSDAADSPIVKLRGSPDQVTVGSGIAYSFDWVK